MWKFNSHLYTIIFYNVHEKKLLSEWQSFNPIRTSNNKLRNTQLLYFLDAYIYRDFLYWLPSICQAVCNMVSCTTLGLRLPLGALATLSHRTIIIALKHTHTHERSAFSCWFDQSSLSLTTKMHYLSNIVSFSCQFHLDTLIIVKVNKWTNYTKYKNIHKISLILKAKN